MDENILATIAFMAMVFGIIAVMATMRLRAARIHADTVGKLIEKLGTSQEAMAYLESEAGQKLLDSVTSRHRNPYSRILLAVSVGSVLCSWGVACVVFSVVADGWQYAETLGQGIIILGFGVGFLIAAAASFKLSKAWGLLNESKSAG